MLWYAVNGLTRKPHAARKLATLAIAVSTLFALSQVLKDLISENTVVSFCLQWIWVPLSLVFLILRYGEILKRRKFRRFFQSIDFVGYDGFIPEYEESAAVNQHLYRVRFRSRIHPSEWEKKKTYIEMFFKRRIYKIEETMEDITTMDIFIIENSLPTLIEWREDYMQTGRRFAVGMGYKGEVVWDASILPHGIVAGATGGGKSTLLRVIAYQAIHKKFNVQVFDFKAGGDFSSIESEYLKYNDLEFGYGPIVISEPEMARNVLVSLIVEVRLRMEQFKNAEVANIDEYNALGRDQFIPWLLIIDEAAEILDVKVKDKEEKALYSEIDQSLRTLARISRAAGVHILFGIIRPSHDVLDGQIKNNALWRVCGYFADSSASRIVLENDNATKLPSEVKGRFIVGGEEVQAYYLPIRKTIQHDRDIIDPDYHKSS